MMWGATRCRLGPGRFCSIGGKIGALVGRRKPCARLSANRYASADHGHPHALMRGGAHR